MALYSLFKRTLVNGRKRYIRVEGTGAYSRATAVSRFQDRLINSAFSHEPLEIRAVQAEKATPAPEIDGMCGPCKSHLHTECIRGECRCACRIFNK